MLKELKQRYGTMLFDSIMPLWLDRSLDKEHGGDFTLASPATGLRHLQVTSGFRGGRFGL